MYTWGSGSLGQLGHGAFVKGGIRNSYEELSPKLLEAFEGKSIVKLEFGATHSAASAYLSLAAALRQLVALASLTTDHCALCSR